MKKFEVRCGDVIGRGKRYRRIIGIVGKVIVYCNGGDHLKRCNEKTFGRWVRGGVVTYLNRGAAGQSNTIKV